MSTILAMNNDRLRSFVSLVLGLVVTSIVIGLIAFSQQNELLAFMAATATPTKTATPPPTATFTPSPTPTATDTPTPTATNTPTLVPPPTFTPTFTPVITNTVPATKTTIVGEVALTTTITFTQTAPLTTTGVVTPTGPPTPTPTPVPRTVLVPAGVPDYPARADHFYFSRPYPEDYQAWGSYYYPYGSNAQGRYFWHYGIDIAGSYGTPIVAAGDGVVTHAGPDDELNLLGPWPDFYGQAVVIKHDRSWQGQPVYTLYGHISKALVRVGRQVEAGDLIAEVGQGGVATGPHLHLEVRVGAGTYFDTRNPDLWVQPDSGFGVIMGRVVDHQGYFVPQQLVTLHRAAEPSRFWRQTYTYPDNQVNPDDAYSETFTFSDVPAGRYLVKTFFDGRQLTQPVTVTEGASNFVLLKQTAPPAPPKAAPAADTLSSEAQSASESETTESPPTTN